MRQLRPLLVTLSACALVPAAAASAAPLDLGAGYEPRVATDPATGTAFIASTTAPSFGSTWQFCRLPRGAAACDPLPPVPVKPEVGSYEVRALLRRPADGALFVVLQASNIDDAEGIAVAASFDQGATWAGPTVLSGDTSNVDGVSLTPDGQAIDVVAGTPDGVLYSRLPLAGPPAGPLANLKPMTPPDEIATDASIVTEADGTVVSGFKYRDRWGLTRVGGPTPRLWARAGRVRASETKQVLVTGPRGTWSLAKRYFLTQLRGRTSLFVRKVGVKRVSKGVGIGRGQVSPAGLGFAQDPLGGLHVAYVVFSGQSHSRVLYTRTRGARGRCSFGAPTAQTGRLADTVTQPQIAAAAPKVALVAWSVGGRLQATFATGGDRPKPKRRQHC